MKKLIYILIFLLPILLLSCSSNSKPSKEEQWIQSIEGNYQWCLKDKSNVRLGISEQRKKELCKANRELLYETTSP